MYDYLYEIETLRLPKYSWMITNNLRIQSYSYHFFSFEFSFLTFSNLYQIWLFVPKERNSRNGNFWNKIRLFLVIQVNSNSVISWWLKFSATVEYDFSKILTFHEFCVHSNIISTLSVSLIYGDVKVWHLGVHSTYNFGE